MSISRKTKAWTLGIFAALYLGLPYALAPWAWRHYEHQSGLANRPMITTTRFGIPGDALNVGLEGDQADVICAMRAADWNPADRVTLRSSARIIGDVLAHDVILLRRQELAPFGVGMGYGIAVCVHRRLSRNVSIKPAARSATLLAPHSPFPRACYPAACPDDDLVMNRAFASAA